MTENSSQYNALVEKIDGKMVAIASTDAQDRHGDSLSVSDWDLKNFKKNPVLQFAHDYSQPPVGLAKNIRVENNKLIFEPVFHEFTQLAREIGRLFQEGIMKAFSVGFIPHTSGDKTRYELLEISAVPVPANPEALVLEKAITPVEDNTKLQIKSWLEKEAEPMQEVVAEVKEAVAEIVEKQGRVLSKKNRATIESAMSALKEVLDADSANDTPVVEDRREMEKEKIEIKRSKPTIELNSDIVEAMAKQIGFIARKVKNNN